MGVYYLDHENTSSDDGEGPLSLRSDDLIIKQFV